MRRRLLALAAATALSTSLVLIGPARWAAATHTGPGPDQLRPELVGDATQLVVVSTRGWSRTAGYLSYYEKRATGWRRVAGPFAARVGRNGTRVDRVEGDGTTPAGSFPLLSAFGLAKPFTKLPYRRLARGDCWISDASRADYNTLVVEQPCGAENEDLYAIARRGAYYKALVTGYNTDPIVSGKGSAIFVHLHSRTRGGATKATSGCVSLSSWQLTVLMRRLDPAANPRIVIGPSSWLAA